MPEYVVIDRLGGGFAVCEYPDGNTRTVPAGALPENAREGDCLRLEGDRLIADPDETRRRREANLALLRGLIKDRD
jgi:hypothetical protein